MCLSISQFCDRLVSDLIAVGNRPAAPALLNASKVEFLYMARWQLDKLGLVFKYLPLEPPFTTYASDVVVPLYDTPAPVLSRAESTDKAEQDLSGMVPEPEKRQDMVLKAPVDADVQLAPSLSGVTLDDIRHPELFKCLGSIESFDAFYKVCYNGDLVVLKFNDFKTFFE